MSPALFGLWLVFSAFLFTIGASAAFPYTGAWMLGLVAWAIGVVPLSFQRWFEARRKHEEDDVAQALTSWSRHAPGAGAKLALAVDEALEEEDERSLERLLRALEGVDGDAFRAERDAFAIAARVWLSDNGGRESRVAHLEVARERARSLGARLRTV
ncbi:MAG: hypothetical protein U0228_07345 [Myxococcaceae bacterium]